MKKNKQVSIYQAAHGAPVNVPAFLSGIQAGFPSPADDYIEKQLDLNELVVRNQPATFYVRVEGESMCDAGIHTGDILVVDRSITPTSGKIVIAIMNGEFTVKRIEMTAKGITLVPENNSFPTIEVSPESDFQVWGVVTYIIHKAN